MGGSGTVLHLHYGNGYTTLICQMYRTASLKWMNFTVCKLYLFGGTRKVGVPRPLVREVGDGVCTGANLENVEIQCLHSFICLET